MGVRNGSKSKSKRKSKNEIEIEIESGECESESEISKSTTIGGTKSQQILYANPCSMASKLIRGRTWTDERYQQVRAVLGDKAMVPRC